MSKISKNVFDKIEKEEITPIPKWAFSLKNITFWLSFGIATVFGGLAFSVVIFVLTESDIDLFLRGPVTMFSFFLLTIPFWWLAFFLVFLGLAGVFFHSTKHGYKRSILVSVGGSVLGSILLGGIVLSLGGANWIDKNLSPVFPWHDRIEEGRAEIWNRPEEGFLAGKITAISVDQKTLSLSDREEGVWQVDISSITPPFSWKKQEGVEFIPENDLIKILGKETGEHSFKAEEIRKWGPRDIMRGRMMKRGGGMMESPPMRFSPLPREEGQ